MKKNNNKEYATVLDDDGINYREIADIMSEIGFVMNHSSARNYVLRVMTKFVEAFDEEWDLRLSDDKIRNVASSAQFQNVISDMLHSLETANSSSN
jgi:hypothetical protein